MSETTVELRHVCFYCGGNASFQPEYMKMSMNVVWSREIRETPCGGCKAIMDIGITFFEVDEHEQPGRVRICDTHWATGRWAVVHPKAAVKLVGTEHAERLLGNKHALVTIEQFKAGKLDLNQNTKH